MIQTTNRTPQKTSLNFFPQIIDKLGGPDHVAELTGRTKRLVRMEDGRVRYEKRNASGMGFGGKRVSIDDVNLHEKSLFMKVQCSAMQCGCALGHRSNKGSNTKKRDNTPFPLPPYESLGRETDRHHIGRGLGRHLPARRPAGGQPTEEGALHAGAGKLSTVSK